MRELSLSVLDIASNSVKAKATCIDISLRFNKSELYVIIADNGCGMTQEFLKNVCDPYTTTRTTRKVGLGIPFFKEAAEQTGGRFEINSKVGEGTVVTAIYITSSVDCPPLGNMGETYYSLLNMANGALITFTIANEKDNYTINSASIMEAVDNDITNPVIAIYIKDLINENINRIIGGKE